MNKYLIVLSVLSLILSCQPKPEEKAPESTEPQPLEEAKPAFEKVQFTTTDGYTVFGDIYRISDTAPVIVLCHQAGFNKFEYHEIAPWLLLLGYNSLAIDQRSGGTMLDSFINETASFNSDKIKELNPSRMEGFLSAQPDIEAAIDYASKLFGQKVILWGSSYSASHALYQGLSNDKVRAVIAFSPGNYYNEAKGSIEEKLEGFSKPLFVTSSRKESSDLTKLIAKLRLADLHVQFIPEGKGQHGSKALWQSNEGYEEYRAAVEDFLNKLK